MQTTKNRKFPLGNSLSYLSCVDFCRVRPSKGQTRLIAICKWIGTLTPTLIGVIERNRFIAATGIICFVLDGLYFFCLSYVQKNEQK